MHKNSHSNNSKPGISRHPNLKGRQFPTKRISCPNALTLSLEKIPVHLPIPDRI